MYLPGGVAGDNVHKITTHQVLSVSQNKINFTSTLRENDVDLP